MPTSPPSANSARTLKNGVDRSTIFVKEGKQSQQQHPSILSPMSVLHREPNLLANERNYHRALSKLEDVGPQNDGRTTHAHGLRKRRFSGLGENRIEKQMEEGASSAAPAEHGQKHKMYGSHSVHCALPGMCCVWDNVSTSCYAHGKRLD